MRNVTTATVTAVLVLAISACGSGTRPRLGRVVHLDGRATGNYVSEISATGASFLLPAADLADQHSQTFEVVAAANTSQALPLSRYTVGVAEATAVVPRDARVELLATGSPGLRFALQWTDTCFGNRMGDNAGGSGQLLLRSPAVVNLTLPGSTRLRSCYLATTAATRTASTLHLSILDH